MLESEVNALIAKLTHATHGHIGRDWRSGKAFVLHSKGNEFQLICEALECLRRIRGRVFSEPF